MTTFTMSDMDAAAETKASGATGTLTIRRGLLLGVVALDALLLGTCFVLYLWVRETTPASFSYASALLDPNVGLVAAGILLVGSLALLVAWRAAELSSRVALIGALAATFLSGAAFLALRGWESNHALRGQIAMADFEPPAADEPSPVALVVSGPKSRGADAARGKAHWMSTCRTCHGDRGEGINGQGKDLRASEFIKSRTDGELVAFVKVGRMPFDKLNTTGIQMPPRGGNPLLKDDDLADIVAYLRTIMTAAPSAAAAAAPAEPAAAPPTTAKVEAPQPIFIAQSTIPNARNAPEGVANSWHYRDATRGSLGVSPRQDELRPAKAHYFFAVFSLMGAVQALHVALGMAFVLFLGAMSLGSLRPALVCKVGVAMVLWNAALVLWLGLIPLFYLMH